MSLFDALDRVATHRLRPFVTPIFDADETRVFTVQDGVPYNFQVGGVEAGWYVMDGAEPVCDAVPTDYLPFMGKLPRFYIIALFPVSDTTWMGVPYNASDAEQRGWKNATPKPIQLVRGTPRPLDAIDARLLGGNLLYNFPASSVQRDTSTPDFKRASSIVRARLEAVRKEQARKALKERKQIERENVGVNFEHQLAVMGADLINWQESGTNRYEVTWEYNGAQFTVPVRRSGVLYSAGICVHDDYGTMGNTADMHDLASAVHLMEDARKKHRFDLDEGLWI